MWPKCLPNIPIKLLLQWKNICPNYDYGRLENSQTFAHKSPFLLRSTSLSLIQERLRTLSFGFSILLSGRNKRIINATTKSWLDQKGLEGMISTTTCLKFSLFGVEGMGGSGVNVHTLLTIIVSFFTKQLKFFLVIHLWWAFHFIYQRISLFLSKKTSLFCCLYCFFFGCCLWIF